MIPEGLDQLCPGHRRAALDADLPGPPDQVRLGPVVVGTALAALSAHPAARGGGRLVRDPGRFFLARALAAELGVHLFVFDLRSGHGLPPYPARPAQTCCSGRAAHPALLASLTATFSRTRASRPTTRTP